MYRLDLDEPARMLRITLSGYWSDETMQGFERDLPAALTRLGQFAHPTACLIDAAQFAVQGKDIAERHRRLLMELDGRMADLVATLIPGALVKAQARRVDEGGRQRFFAHVGDALEWIRAERAACRPG